MEKLSAALERMAGKEDAALMGDEGNESQNPYVKAVNKVWLWWRCCGVRLLPRVYAQAFSASVLCARCVLVARKLPRTQNGGGWMWVGCDDDCGLVNVAEAENCQEKNAQDQCHGRKRPRKLEQVSSIARVTTYRVVPSRLRRTACALIS